MCAVENTDVQKDLKLLKHRFKVALDNHDDAARKSRNQDKKLLESLDEAIGVIDERLDTSRFASVQNFEKLKADNHVSSLAVSAAEVASSNFFAVFRLTVCWSVTSLASRRSAT